MPVRRTLALTAIVAAGVLLGCGGTSPMAATPSASARPDAITGVGDLQIGTDTVYTAGALLPDGRVLLVGQQGPDGLQVRVDIVDVAP